jgi:hypothetical protein
MSRSIWDPYSILLAYGMKRKKIHHIERMSCYNDVGKTIPGIGLAEPESESIRTRHLKECILKTSYIPKDSACSTCVSVLSSNAYSAPGEHQRILLKSIECPVYRKPPYSSNCTGVSAEISVPTRHTRIAGIEDIAIPIRNIGSSENTSRKKSSIETRATASVNPFFRNYQTPPCPTPITPSVYGQPGVPIPPLPRCILGNRRVDAGV